MTDSVGSSSNIPQDSQNPTQQAQNLENELYQDELTYSSIPSQVTALQDSASFISKVSALIQSTSVPEGVDRDALLQNLSSVSSSVNNFNTQLNTTPNTNIINEATSFALNISDASTKVLEASNAYLNVKNPTPEQSDVGQDLGELGQSLGNLATALSNSLPS